MNALNQFKHPIYQQLYELIKPI